MTLPPLELWAGPEASVARVGDGWFDQLEATGFAHRADDLDRIADLGARAVRLPVLMERTMPERGRFDFRWADERLERCRALGLRPIVGLLHHGGGPAWTQLLDPAFASHVAAYAARVAERYPWVEDWTPVNEPLTTARFAALYGHWHPHRRDDAAFVRALLNQVHAVAAAMRAVRQVQPAARLVQTEDLGCVRGRAALAPQVHYEGERRWLSLDLLAGRVQPGHPMHRWLTGHKAGPAELDALASAPTMPDIVGLNVYVTSERFLDERTALYPPALHGGNGRTAYADTEAVRVHGARFGGFAARLREAWARYGRPLALTEVHLGCTREEQQRWLLEAWRAAEHARAGGADVRAVTAWSVFGAFDWNSLMTRPRGDYEPGLFDVRGPRPRPTALARLARELARGTPPADPWLAHPGWWRRASRAVHPARCAGRARAREAPPAGPPLLVLGGRGTLGHAFARACERRGLAVRLLPGRDALDIADPAAVRDALAAHAPWAVVNAAGYVRVDEAEHDERQWSANALGPAVLAGACRAVGARLLSFSSDLVFDGAQQHPYTERDTPRPLNAYGRAKHHADRLIAAEPHCLVVRTAAFFGPWDRANFLAGGLARLRAGDDWPAIDDQTVSPTYVPDLVDACLDLLVDGEHGLWHVANRGAATWYDFACRTAEAAGLPRARVRRIDSAQAGQQARRPVYSALASERGQFAPALDSAIARYLAAVSPGVRNAAG